MRLERFAQREVRSEAKANNIPSDWFTSNEKTKYEKVAALTKLLEILLFGNHNFECNRMAAVPQGAFAALQVRKNFKHSAIAKYQEEEEEEEQKDNKSCGFNAKVLQEGRELTPLKYNSKLMNSIWGLYNRYSVHNLKKIYANDTSFLAESWGSLNPGGAAETVIAEGPAARFIGASGAGH